MGIFRKENNPFWVTTQLTQWNLLVLKAHLKCRFQKNRLDSFPINPLPAVIPQAQKEKAQFFDNLAQQWYLNHLCEAAMYQ